MNVSDQEAFGIETRRALDFLNSKGYQYSGARTASTPALGQYLEALWSQPLTGLRVRVAYLPPLKSHPDALRVFVEKGGEDSFAIDDFLKSQGINEELPALMSYQGDFAHRLAASLDAAKHVMERHLSPIIEGATWTHVPIDWAGQR